MSDSVKLPTNWCYATLGKSCKILAGFGFPERLQGKTSGDLPFFKVGDISEAWKRGETHLTKANHYLSQKEAEEIRARPLPKNTTVFAKIGAAIALNRRAILSEPALVDNNVMGLYPATEAIDHKFLFHFICTVKLDELSRATTVPSVRKSDIEQTRIPLPPLPEQRRIVAEIEKQFSRLEEGVTALKRVQTNLKRYRAAMLKAACEGRLVPTEAELHKSGSCVSPLGKSRDGSSALPYETGEQLLKRILEERRKNWSGRGKYKEPIAPDTAKLPKLPEGWTWASLDQIARSSSYGTSAKCSFENLGPPVLRIPNIASGQIDLTDLKFAGIDERLEAGEELLPGDLLVIRTNGSKNLIGRSAVIRTNLSRATGYASYLIRFRLFNSPTLCNWVGSIWDVSFLREWIEKRAATSAGQHNISMSVLSTLPIPLPPLAEQKRIVEEVERRLNVIDELESLVTTNLQRASRLRQAVLKKAFTERFF